MLVAILEMLTALPDGAVPLVFATAIDVVGVPNALTLTAITGYVVAGYPVLEPNIPNPPPFPPNLRGSAEIATANPSSGGLATRISGGDVAFLVKNVVDITNDLVRSSSVLV
jgi:hypothetical protein